jgi:adenosine deaminase
VPVSENVSGLDSIRRALALGADRLGHGIQAHLDADVRAFLKKTQKPLELCPWTNVMLKCVPHYKAHPVKDFLEDGLNVNLNTDNRLVSKITLTRQLCQLWQHGLVTKWDHVKTLILNGVRSSFIAEPERKQVEQEVQQALSRLKRRFEKTIARYLPAAQSTKEA